QPRSFCIVGKRNEICTRACSNQSSAIRNELFHLGTTSLPQCNRLACGAASRKHYDIIVGQSIRSNRCTRNGGNVETTVSGKDVDSGIDRFGCGGTAIRIVENRDFNSGRRKHCRPGGWG